MDDRFGSKATLTARKSDFRFTLEKRTQSEHRTTSIWCRFGLMHRSKQLKFFVHFVGAREVKMRDYDFTELARVKRLNSLKAICARATEITPKRCSPALMQPEDSVHGA